MQRPHAMHVWCSYHVVLYKINAAWACFEAGHFWGHTQRMWTDFSIYTSLSCLFVLDVMKLLSENFPLKAWKC